MKRVLLTASLMLGIAAPAAAATPMGEWLVENGKAKIRIGQCQNELWGVLSWAETPGKDENNPDPAKRNRSIIGMPILLAMKPSDDNTWKGEVYNAEDGRTYSASISLEDESELEIKGCVLGGLFCGGETWTRARPEDGQPAVAADAGCPLETVPRR